MSASYIAMLEGLTLPGRQKKMARRRRKRKGSSKIGRAMKWCWKRHKNKRAVYKCVRHRMKK